MDPEVFKISISALVESGIVVLPWGYWPGSYPGGTYPFATSEEWDSYDWNPPEFMQGPDFPSEPDQRASDKPTWDQIMAAGEAAIARQDRDRAFDDLREECRSRITLAYGEATSEDEVFLRLRNRQTLEQDAERERLLEVYAGLKDRLGNLSERGLKLFDPTNDRLWNPPPA